MCASPTAGRPYDLVAAFDGIKSATRRTVFGAAQDAVYSGFGVFRVTLPRPSYVDGVRVYQALGVKAGFIPLSAQTMYMFVVTPDPQGISHRPQDFAAILRERMAPFGALPGEVREALKPSDDIVYSPISDVLLPLPWFSGRVGILGDAAHACAPHLTQGAGMALEDGLVLADCRTPAARRTRGYEHSRSAGSPGPGWCRTSRAGSSKPRWASTPATMTRQSRACATTWWSRRTRWKPSSTSLPSAGYRLSAG